MGAASMPDPPGRPQHRLQLQQQQQEEEEVRSFRRRAERLRAAVPKKARVERRRLQQELDAEERALLARHAREREDADGGGVGTANDDCGAAAARVAEAFARQATVSESTCPRRQQQRQQDEDEKDEKEEEEEMEEEAAANKGFYASQTVSRKQRKKQARAAAEAEAERQREADKAAAGPSERELELQRIDTLLAPNRLRVRQVRPDGHCLYRAIAHQLRLRGDESVPAPAAYDGEHDGTEAPRERETIPSSEDECVWLLRDIASAFMLRHKEEFMPFAEDHVDAVDQHDGAPPNDGPMDEARFERYCSKLGSTAVWGGQLEIRALSQALRAPFEVYSDPHVMDVLRMGDEFRADADDGDDGQRLHRRRAAPVRLTYHRKYYGLGEHYNSVAGIDDQDDGDEGDGNAEAA